MSVEVRVCLEIGTTDGETAVRVLKSESVLRPTVHQTTSEDLALLAKSALDRLAAEARESAMEQADVFIAAMADAARAQPFELDGDGKPASPATRAFVESLPAHVRRSDHLVEVIHDCIAESLPIGNVTRQIVLREVEKRERQHPSEGHGGAVD